jgi:hypothetical protein
MAFSLEDYTTVRERIAIFWERYPDGAIRTELIEASNTRFVVLCKLFKNANDTQPFATGHAQEVISDRGVNRDFALENCETSSVGVAAKNANIGTEKNAPSREEMEKVKRLEQNKSAIYSPPNSRARLVENAIRQSFDDEVKAAVNPEPTTWSVGDIAQALSTKPKAQECKHGAMILKEGTAKTGKPYYGYVCSAPKGEQCDAKWAVTAANGSWFFREEE